MTSAFHEKTTPAPLLYRKFIKTQAPAHHWYLLLILFHRRNVSTVILRS